MTPARRKLLDKALEDILNSDRILDLQQRMEESMFQEIVKVNITEEIDEGSDFVKHARDSARQRASLVVAGAVRNQLAVILEHIEIPLEADGQRLGEIVVDIMEPYKGLNKTQAKKMAELERYYRTKEAGDIGKYRGKLLDVNARLKGERIGKIIEEEAFHADKAGAYATASDLGFKAKRSIHSGDMLVCPVCIENAGVGWIPIDDTYPSGEIAPPFHPNCRCDEVYAKEDVLQEQGAAV